MSNFTKSNKISGHYISSDNIKNLKFKVKFKEINTTIPLPKFETFMSSSKQDVEASSGYYEEKVFKWQEKIFSPAEIYQYTDKNKCISELQKNYNEIINRDSLSLQNYTKKIFSYVEDDKYDATSKLTTDKQPYANLLSEKMEGIIFEDKPGGGNETQAVEDIELITENHEKFIIQSADRKTAASENMFILVDMNKKESDPTYLLKRENILFTLTWNTDRHSLTVTPDFNDIVVNPYFLEISYDSKQLFHYSIELVVGDRLDEAKLAELDLLKKVAQSRKDLRNRKLFRTFPVPPKEVLKCFYMVEIVSANSFEYDNLYVEYTVELPYGYTCADPLKSVTQISSTRGLDKTAHFNHLFELCIYYHTDIAGNDRDTLPQEPEMYLEVLSCDSWDRHRTEGYCHTKLPLMRLGEFRATLQCVRPQGSDRRLWEMRRFFVGGRHLLNDITWTGTPSTFKGSKLSKHGVKCISNGQLEIKINTVLQSQSFIKKKQKYLDDQLKEPIEHLSADSLFKSVNTVLKAYKHAKEKLVSCQEGAGDN